MTPTECQALYDRAFAAGVEAARSVVPQPMTVTQHANPFNPYSEVVFRDVVSDGPCGFAWVVVRPGNSSFARWLRSQRLARPGYNGGVHIWISDYNQSMQRKEAHACAMARVLRDSGINAYADSRMD